MATFDLRRSEVLPTTDGRFRVEELEERRESSFCIPAFIVAEAASERDDERGEDEPGGPWWGSGLVVGMRA